MLEIKLLNQTKLEQAFQRRFNLSGDNYKARCPFHSDNTPSFYVHKDEYIGNCFGCGTSGSVDVLVAQYLSVSKIEARTILDISMEDVLLSSSRNARESKQRTRSTSIPESWLAPWPKEIHPYITRRGFTIDTLKRAEVRYDRALQRQVFPVRNTRGSLAGAVGRSTCGQDPKWYVYWNSEGIKEQLYLLPKVLSTSGRSQGRSTPLCLVEGPLDCLWLEQNGVQAAATLGTKITDRQIEHLLDITDHVILALDNDESGREATERVYQRVKRSLRVSFVEWLENDPVGVENVREIVDSAVNYVQRQTIW